MAAPKSRKKVASRPAGKKGRKAKPAEPPPVPADEPKTVNARPHDPNIAELEAQLLSRYPHAVSGTLLLAGDPNGFPTKRSVRIRCRICGSEDRRVATSDLFQSHTCGGKDCLKAARQEVAKS